MTLGITIGLSLYFVWMLSRCFVRVDQGHVAVLVSFGAALRDGKKKIQTLPPGLHLKAPWQVATIVSLKEQNLELSGDDSGRTAMAEDGTVLRFDSILRFVPDRDALDEYLFGVQHRKEHITGLFVCLLRNEIANFRTPVDPLKGPVSRLKEVDAGSYAVLRTERKTLNERIESFAKLRIGAELYGVQFNAVDLLDILPPDELADALNAVMNARAEAEVQYARAESDCEQRMLAAQRGVDIATARARAVEREIVRLGQHLGELAQNGTLNAYVARRRTEVYADAKNVYLRGGR